MPSTSLSWASIMLSWFKSWWYELISFPTQLCSLILICTLLQVRKQEEANKSTKASAAAIQKFTARLAKAFIRYFMN
jgi:hypothetical protein